MVNDESGFVTFLDKNDKNDNDPGIKLIRRIEKYF
jgi:hypothetical protein